MNTATAEKIAKELGAEEVGSHHQSHTGAEQTLVQFPNGYGASIIIGGSMAYGGLEMAVLMKDEDGWGITYDTPLTSDVLGHLTDEDITTYLTQISQL